MEGTIAEIRLFAGRFAPRGWMLCNGSMLPVNNQHAALYSLIGTSYGGDGHSFALPKLDAPAGMCFVICHDGDYPARP